MGKTDQLKAMSNNSVNPGALFGYQINLYFGFYYHAWSMLDLLCTLLHDVTLE